MQLAPHGGRLSWPPGRSDCSALLELLVRSERAHVLNFRASCFISLHSDAKLAYCRGGMLSTTWQGECVARCLAVVPNITSPNVRPWW
jgi:hypothetical protein